MAEFLQRESNKITIANFYEDYQLNKYNFEPPYQRRSVWSEEKKSFFIDSILKNYPIPPVFLHQKIDDQTGKTTYDVIDGKQRLTAIIEFIEGEIPVANEMDEPFSDSRVSGLFFSDFASDELARYKGQFWRYVIPIEYVDTGEQSVIDSIFDRLNRNGEPLEGQELRNSNYYNTPLLLGLERLSKEEFWCERLATVDRNRMEDIEFLSELVFLVLNGEELHANQSELDAMYEAYANADNIDEAIHEVNKVTEYMRDLELPYEEWRIRGVSHLYGIFSFSHFCIVNGIALSGIKDKVHEFYTKWRNREYDEELVKQYKDSMSSRTKDKGQRRKRREALVNYCVKK